MVFFNDPVPLRRRAARARSGWRVAMRTRVRGARRALARARGTTSRWASGSPRATRRSAGSASRAASTTPPSAASPTWRPGCARDAEPWQILVTAAGVHRPPSASVVGERRGRAASCAGFSRPVHVFDVNGHRQLRGARHDRRPVDAPVAAPTCCPTLDEDERYRRFDELQAPDGAASGTSMRLNHDDESVVVVPSITPRPGRGAQRQP